MVALFKKSFGDLFGADQEAEFTDKHIAEIKHLIQNEAIAGLHKKGVIKQHTITFDDGTTGSPIFTIDKDRNLKTMFT